MGKKLKMLPAFVRVNFNYIIRSADWKGVIKTNLLSPGEGGVLKLHWKRKVMDKFVIARIPQGKHDVEGSSISLR